MKIIVNRQVIDEQWLTLTVDQAVPAGDVIVPLQTWLAQRESLQNHAGKLGLLLEGDDAVETIVADLPRFDLVAVNFPKYTDGRGFSLARLLRDRYQFVGELRAVGNFLRDQLSFLERCGFNAFVLTEDPIAALQSFDDISVKYQTAADRALPVYRCR
ncbi:MAG: DUF934 domain-containing protein [Gammaproteobacteria bacterium]|nr:DUF934 domain-containing protein [Gammaproteobacteria bacterium]